MKHLLFGMGFVAALSLAGCAYISSVTNSKEFQAFCKWSPLAISAIEAAAIESAKDPAKQDVTNSLSQTVMFLRVASAQCPVVKTP